MAKNSSSASPPNKMLSMSPPALVGSMRITKTLLLLPMAL